MPAANGIEKRKVRGAFDAIAADKAWEALYSGEIGYRSYRFMSRRRAVEELLEPHAIGKVLDLGCGTGDLSPYFVRKNVSYIGLDISSEMTARAHVNYSASVRSGAANFLVGDCENLAFDDASFDIVIAVGLIEYFSDPSKALGEIRRVTKRRGVAVITVPHNNCLNNRFVDIFAPVRDVLIPVYARVTGAPLARMKHIVHHRHVPAEFDSMMREASFRKLAERYTNFHFLFYPLEYFLPSLYIKLSEGVDRSGKGKKYQRFASNYIGLYQRI